MEQGDLYGVPLERFVAERGELAKHLRRDGREQDAARVAALRKPSVAAWAVNQLVRTQSRAVAALFEAGDALHRAQAELLAGRGDAGALREARQRERAAVEKLGATAEGLLSFEGHELTRATLDRVTETLHAAALDEDARAKVKDGCLERELRHVGLGASEAAGLPGAAAGRAPARTARGPEKPTADAQAARRRARSERLTAAREAEAKARRVAERAARGLETARERRDRAADALNAADRALAEARERAEEAERTHREAREELDRGQ